MNVGDTVRVISATEEEVKVETPIKIEYVNSEMDVGDTVRVISVTEEEVNVETPIKIEYVNSEMDVGDTVRVISATEEEVDVETPIKTEYIKFEVDVGDQYEDDVDGVPLENTNKDSTSDSEDHTPLQSISKQWKAETIHFPLFTYAKIKSEVRLKRSNESEIKTSQILKLDAREIFLSKEEQLQLMLERSESLNYQNSPFRCDLCYKGFVDIKTFKNHQEKHDEVLQLPKKLQSNNETEKEIQKSQAPLKKTDKCEENKAQNEDSRKIPEFIIRSNTFKTPYVILNRVNTPIKTIILNIETTTSNINSDIKNSKTAANSNEQATAPNHIFICDVCKKEYLCKSLLENHIKKWHIIGIEQNCINTNLSIGKDVLKNNNVRENKLSKNKNQHKDSICSDETQYKCSYCKKCFSQRGSLANHVRTYTGEKPYKCSYCMKCFTRSSELAKHVRTHTGEKPYKCSYCTKCFTISGNLARHVRTHTGEKPYKCSYCIKCFSDSSTLASHVRTHTGEKPYKCSYCTKCFSYNSSLATHVRIHTGDKPYKCSYCMKCFIQSGDLTAHVRTHTGEKPYKCSYCTKCFSDGSNLANHVRTHSGEKPYKCNYCIKCFSDSSALATHVRIHKSDKDKILQ